MNDQICIHMAQLSPNKSMFEVMQWCMYCRYRCLSSRLTGDKHVEAVHKAEQLTQTEHFYIFSLALMNGRSDWGHPEVSSSRDHAWLLYPFCPLFTGRYWHLSHISQCGYLCILESLIKYNAVENKLHFLGSFPAPEQCKVHQWCYWQVHQPRLPESPTMFVRTIVANLNFYQS